MQYLGYLVFILFNRLISLLPWRILYIFSNIIAWLLDKVFAYRKNVILKNLEFAMPELSSSDKSKLLRPIYRNFSDILLESFKSSFTAPEIIHERYKFVTTPEFESDYNLENGVAVYAAHYGNWEWASISLQVQTPYQVVALIKPLTNKYINKFIWANRSANGTKLIDIYKSKEDVYATYERPSSVIYVSDQNPSNKTKAQKINFFGKETLAVHGAAGYATQFPEKSVWFYQITRTDRGWYTIAPVKVADANEPGLTGHELTQRYFNLLEEQIRKQPSDWLWTHKRWKSQINY